MRHQHTVLFVDDEVNILKALQRLLRKYGLKSAEYRKQRRAVAAADSAHRES